MFSLFSAQEKQIFIGNIMFVACCAFYLAWWILSFKPSGAVAGMGWLLIPAALAGLIGLITILMGVSVKAPSEPLIPGALILLGGIAAFFVLLAVTVLLFKRPPTTELILIVGWAALALAETNALFGAGLFTRGLTVGFFLTVSVALAISLVCYVLYYGLDSLAGYIDGMIPLPLAGLIMAGISCFMAVRVR